MPLSNLLKGGKNFGLAEEMRLSLEIQGAGRFVQFTSTFHKQHGKQEIMDGYYTRYHSCLPQGKAGGLQILCCSAEGGR